jgi:hypothetical protein
VWAIRVVARDEIVEPGLLLEYVAGRWRGRFALQGEVDPESQWSNAECQGPAAYVCIVI